MIGCHSYRQIRIYASLFFLCVCWFVFFLFVSCFFYLLAVEFCLFLGSNRQRLCVVGLHCCGDLSSAVLNYFIKSSFVSLHSLILFGCCYHKMSPSSTIVVVVDVVICKT